MYFVILFLAPNWNTDCSQIYPKVFSTDFIFRQQENLFDNQWIQATMQQNTYYTMATKKNQIGKPVEC